MGKFQDLTGQRFGRLVAIKPIGKSKKSGTIWECQCDCGNTVNQPINKLVFDRVKSCGCYRKEFKTFNAKYDYETRLYNIWNKMKDRCNNNKTDCYKNYGGRGICVCKEWVVNLIVGLSGTILGFIGGIITKTYSIKIKQKATGTNNRQNIGNKQ